MRFFICLLLSIYIATVCCVPANTMYGNTMMYGQGWMQQPIVGGLGQTVDQQYGGELYPSQPESEQPIVGGWNTVDEYGNMMEDNTMIEQPIISQRLPYHRSQRILGANVVQQQLPNVNRIMSREQQQFTPNVGYFPQQFTEQDFPIQQRVVRPYSSYRPTRYSAPLMKAPTGVVNALWHQINQNAILSTQQEPIQSLLHISPEEQSVMNQQWAQKWKYGAVNPRTFQQQFTTLPMMSGTKSPVMTFAGRSTNTPIVQSAVYSNMPTVVNHLQGQLSVPVQQPITSNSAIWRSPLYQRNQPLVQQPILEAKNAQFMQSLYPNANLHNVGFGGNIGFGTVPTQTMNELNLQQQQQFPNELSNNMNMNNMLPLNKQFGTGLSGLTGFDTPKDVPTTIDTGVGSMIGGQQQQMLPVQTGVESGVTGGMQQQQMFGGRGQQQQ